MALINLKRGAKKLLNAGSEVKQGVGRLFGGKGSAVKRKASTAKQNFRQIAKNQADTKKVTRGLHGVHEEGISQGVNVTTSAGSSAKPIKINTNPKDAARKVPRNQASPVARDMASEYEDMSKRVDKVRSMNDITNDKSIDMSFTDEQYRNVLSSGEINKRTNNLGENFNDLISDKNLDRLSNADQSEVAQIKQNLTDSANSKRIRNPERAVDDSLNLKFQDGSVEHELGGLDPNDMSGSYGDYLKAGEFNTDAGLADTSGKGVVQQAVDSIKGDGGRIKPHSSAISYEKSVVDAGNNFKLDQVIRNNELNESSINKMNSINKRLTANQKQIRSAGKESIDQNSNIVDFYSSVFGAGANEVNMMGVKGELGEQAVGGLRAMSGQRINHQWNSMNALNKTGTVLTGAAATSSALRMGQGRAPFRDRHGSFDLPGVPFL